MKFKPQTTSLWRCFCLCVCQDYEHSIMLQIINKRDIKSGNIVTATTWSLLSWLWLLFYLTVKLNVIVTKPPTPYKWTTPLEETKQTIKFSYIKQCSAMLTSAVKNISRLTIYNVLNSTCTAPEKTPPPPPPQEVNGNSKGKGGRSKSVKRKVWM